MKVTPNVSDPIGKPHYFKRRFILTSMRW